MKKQQPFLHRTWFAIVIFLFLISVADAKVQIFSHYFNQPEFVKYQYMFFKKNMLDEYELVVFEDSSDPLISQQIKDECEKYGIRYVHIPESVFLSPKFPLSGVSEDGLNPSGGCAIATQYIYDHYVMNSQDICLILDNDIFLMAPFSVEKYLGENPFAYECETRGPVNYMLPNFLLFNPKLMPEKEILDFNLGTILGNATDSGGYSYFYLSKYANLGVQIPKYYLFNTFSPLKQRYLTLSPFLFTSEEWSSHSFIEEDLFLHLRMGSNWSRHPHYQEIKQEIEFLFEKLLSGKENYQSWWQEALGSAISLEDFGMWLGGEDALSRKRMCSHVLAENYQSILDIPCGLCFDYYGLKKEGIPIAYLGMDVTPQLINRATEHNIPVALGSIESIPLADHTFDIAYARHILEHLPHYEPGLSELLRVAKKEVFIVFFISPHECTEHLIQAPYINGHLVYHNRYSKGKIEESLSRHENISHWTWEKLSTGEEILHIFLRSPKIVAKRFM